MTQLDPKTAGLTGLFHVSLSRGSWGPTVHCCFDPVNMQSIPILFGLHWNV